MSPAIEAYETEYKRWALDRFPNTQLWTVNRDRQVKTALLSYGAACSALQSMRQSACETAAAKAEETMQISLPDWFEELVGAA